MDVHLAFRKGEARGQRPCGGPLGGPSAVSGIHGHLCLKTANGKRSEITAVRRSEGRDGIPQRPARCLCPAPLRPALRLSRSPWPSPGRSRVSARVFRSPLPRLVTATKCGSSDAAARSARGKPGGASWKHAPKAGLLLSVASGVRCGSWGVLPAAAAFDFGSQVGSSP